MFKNSVYNVWFVIGLIVLLIIGFIINDLQKAEQLNIENKAELKANGIKTEALTYDYGWRGNTRKFSLKERKRVVFYVYFADSQKFESIKELDSNDSRFDNLSKHVHPLVWKLIYSKINPRINDLILDTPLDSITDFNLQNYVVEYYQLPNIDKFYKIFNEKPMKNKSLSIDKPLH